MKIECDINGPYLSEIDGISYDWNINGIFIPDFVMYTLHSMAMA